ncbi:MAG: hypothetical protein IOD15_01595 [Phycisphaerales bacterium]|nr:hypothetical protein [Phycisphaerales bacterium]
MSLADLFDHTGTPTADYRLTIWVFDEAVFQQQQTSPTAQLPALTLLSAATDPLPSVFDIHIQPPTPDGSFNVYPEFPLSFPAPVGIREGLAFLGSVQVQSPGSDPDEFRSRVRLVGRILGNIGRDPATSGGIRDEIHVGQVWRLEAFTNNLEPRSATGNIRANIRTTGPWVNRGLGADQLAHFGIGVLSADSGIDGNITTGSRPRRPDGNGGFVYPDAQARQEFNPGHIRRIAVERQFGQSSIGLVGSTIAAGAPTIQLIDGEPVSKPLPGSIGEIFSAGNLGTAARPLNITVGDSLHFMRAVAPSGQSRFSLGEQDVHANITTGTSVLAFLPDLSAFGIEVPTVAGALQRLETGGNFFGDLNLGNLTGNSIRLCRTPLLPSTSTLDQHIASASSEPLIRESLVHSGILVRGRFDGQISVRGAVHYADIIASTFTHPITIGHGLKGSIVAFGDPAATPGDGHLPGLTVGFEPLLDVPVLSNILPGFCGVAAGPVWMYTNPEMMRSTEQVWFEPGGIDNGSFVSYLGGSMDGLIRAASAGPVNIVNMSNVPFVDGAPSKFAPRIEIVNGQTLDIGVFYAGVVWSDLLEYGPTSGQVENVPANDFASFSRISLNCMGAAADLWYTDAPLLSVGQDVRGQIRTPSLSASQTITIGGTLAEQIHETIVGQFGCDAVDSTPDRGSEPSPRGNNPEADDGARAAPLGAIYVVQPGGLAGQVTLEANNTTTTQDTSRLAGFVRVGGFLLPEPPATTPLPLTFATNLSPVAGVTPETTLPLYPTRSIDLGGGAIGVVPFAVHLADSPAVTGADSIFPPFILPTALRISGLPLRYCGPVVMTVPQPTGTITSRGIGTTGPFLAPNSGQNFTGAATGRTMTLTATQSSQILPLEYQAIPDTFGVQSLVTLPTGLVTRNTLADTAVYYRVGCGFGGNPNPADVTGIGGPPAAPDNQVTGDDFNAFIAAFAGGDLFADIVGIGGIGTAPDGLLTGDDFNAFIAAFIAGCEQ